MLELIRSKKIFIVGLPFAFLSFGHVPIAIFPHIFDKNQAAQFITLGIVSIAMGLFIFFRAGRYATHRYVFWLLFCTMGAVLLSALLSGNIVSSLTGDTGRYAGVVALFALLIVAIFHAPVSFENLKRLVEIYVSITFIVALLGIAQHFKFVDFPGDQGVTSVLGNQDFFAAYLGTASPLYFFLCIEASLRKRIFIVIAFSIVFMSLIWATPLQAYVDIAFTVLGILIFAIRKKIPRRQWTLNARTFLGTFAIIIWAEFIFLVPFLGHWIPVLGNDIQVKIRANFWLAGTRQFFDFPFLGVGPDQYGNYYEQYRTLGDARAYEKILSNDAHSAPVQTLATLGLVGTLCLILLLAVAVRSFFIQWDRNPHQRIWLFALGLFFFVYMTNSFVSPMSLPSKYLFWALCGWVIGKTYLIRDESSKTLRAPITGMIVIILFVIANFIPAQIKYAVAFEKYAKDQKSIGTYTYSPYLPCFMYFEGSFHIIENRPLNDILQLTRDQLGSNPRCYSAHLILAQLYRGTGDLENLKYQIQQMVQISPYRVEALRMGLDYASKVGDIQLYDVLQKRMNQLGLVYVPGKQE